ncbi:MAG: hypothetical protein ACLFQB_04030 [Chitinispirillaceae bacterium]
MERSILHINVVNFFVSVARVLNPRLKERPVAVVSAGAGRKVVLDMSAEAFEAGVRRGMSPEAAQRTCRDLTLTSPLPSAYERAEGVLMKGASQLSPKAETAGPGHLFIDLTGTRRLLGPSVDVGDRFRKQILRECRFDSAVGVASNRLVSKVATRVIKPKGLCSVMSGCEEEFMAPLPVTFLPGLDNRILNQLLQFNVHTVQDILQIPPADLACALGPAAKDIYDQARGIDESSVRDIVQPPPSVRETLTLQEQTNDEQMISCALFHLVSRAGCRVRDMGLGTGRIRLRISYADGTAASRLLKLPFPVQGDLSLFDYAYEVLRKIFTRRVRLSELDLECTELTFPYGQMDMFVDSQKERHLMGALDQIRKNFGEKSIKFWGRDVA